MKKLLLVSTALTVFFAGSALATISDGQLRLIHTRRRHPVFSWTGFYIGGNLGGAWARGTVSDSLFGLSASSDRSGFIGGGQLGVNYQFSNIVLGAEWDFDWTSLDATGNGRFVPGLGTPRDRQTRAGYRRWPLGSAWCLAAARSSMARPAGGASTIMPPSRTSTPGPRSAHPI